MKQNEQAIDFVISWHDGNDPAWLDEKQHYLRELTQNENVDVRSIRYRDWDYLHYWFRAVEQYAPWVRKIHLLTWGHVPQWLNLEHPKLHVVNHRDYIPEEYLPTFSSHPIELFMHRIPGLAEHFVYFNDDFFLTAPVKPTDFFVNGLPCDALSEAPIDCDDNVWSHVRMNDTIFSSRHFSRKAVRKKYWRKWYSWRNLWETANNILFLCLNRDHFFGLRFHHLPQSYLKSTFEKVWELEPELLHETCTHRFRDARDVSHAVFKNYQLLTGQFQPYAIHKNGRVFSGNWDPEKVGDVIEKRKCKMICINDSVDIDFEQAKTIVHQAFEKTLPEKSSFER